MMNERLAARQTAFHDRDDNEDDYRHRGNGDDDDHHHHDNGDYEVDHRNSLHTSCKAKLQGQIRRASKEHGFEKG